MPKIFQTLWWAGVGCVAAAVGCALLLPVWVDQVILWYGLMFVLGIFAGSALTVQSLNHFQAIAEGQDAPCIHTARSLRWWLEDMIGPKPACGYISESSGSSPARGSSSTSRTRHMEPLRVGDYEIHPQ